MVKFVCPKITFLCFYIALPLNFKWKGKALCLFKSPLTLYLNAYLWQLLIRSYDKPIQHIKKQRHYFANKGPYSQNYGFSSSHVWMWELDHKERWVLKNWWVWTVMLNKTLESPLDCKEIKPVQPKGNQPWRFIGRTDAEAETPILWPPDVKNWLIRKDPDSGKLKAGGEGDDRGRDGWMRSLTRWTWVWAGSRRQWKTGKPGVLQSMGSLRVGHDWVNNSNNNKHSAVLKSESAVESERSDFKISYFWSTKSM